MTTISTAPRAPYALEPTTFPFPALAALAGRAPLGGPRETALACLLVGRIVVDATATNPVLSPDQNRARVLAAKRWLGSAALAAGIRVALSRLAESTCSENHTALKLALDSVITVTANQLDGSARLELGRLAQAVAE